MARSITWTTSALCVSALLVCACSKQSTPRSESPPPPESPQASADLGVNVAELTPVVDNPFVAFASVKRTVYEGTERDDATKKMVKIRMESTVRDAPEAVAGTQVTAVDVSDFDGEELVEKTVDYYAQDRSGVVYYIGEKVDDYEDGKVTGHGGQWMAGENGSRAGVFMPAAPKVGDVFEQERAPQIAEDRSTVLATGLTVTVPAGTFNDCIETEDYDPVGKTKMRKVYCRGVGLVREVYSAGGSIELTKLETR